MVVNLVEGVIPENGTNNEADRYPVACILADKEYIVIAEVDGGPAVTNGCGVAAPTASVSRQSWPPKLTCGTCLAFASYHNEVSR